MNVHVPRKQLTTSLGHVERIIPNRSSNPNLSLMRIMLKEKTLVFSGSNMDIDIEAAVPAEVEETGEFALPAHVFAQVVRSLPGEMVELEFNDTELTIASGNYATKLQLVEATGAPSLKFPDTYEGRLAAGELAAALAQVRYAAAVAEYQAIFRGVKLELSDKKTRAVATDGFRLAYYNWEVASGLDGELVLPARSVDELTKLLESGEAELHLDDTQLSVKNGGVRTNIKLMEGTFPDYGRVIPSTFPVSISIDAQQLSETVSRVAVMADKTANNRVDLFVKGGTLQITAEGNYGRSQEALEVLQEGSDPEIVLAYNAKYLIDALTPISGDLKLSFSGTTTPSVMSSLKDPNYLAMVVPLRL